MTYQHNWNDGRSCELPAGKVVCVGRNYAAHAKELNNPVPAEPILFIKPSTSLRPMVEPIVVPKGRGDCHVETELALLIGRDLTQASIEESVQAIVGIGLGFDLTLRSEQSALKEKGLPWDKAKAFDGACPLSNFLPVSQVLAWPDFSLQLLLNGQVQQQGSTADMLTPIPELLAYMSRYFTLKAGDVVLTGTPAGVCAINSGDQLRASLLDLDVQTQVL